MGKPPSFGRFIPLWIVLYGGYHVTDNWADDIPISDEEIRLLAAFWFDLAPELDIDA